MPRPRWPTPWRWWPPAAVGERVLALEGEPGDWIPEGFRVIPQVGDTFNERLARAWTDADDGGVQIGMDTPQLTVELLEDALDRVAPGRAVLGPATDGGWWALGLAAPDPTVFDGVVMSRADTGAQQRRRLEAAGYDVVEIDTIIDVDHHDEAVAVAAAAPHLESSRLIRRFAVDACATLPDDE